MYDFCIVGGGIVGLATAVKLLEARPGCSIVLLEKEDELARHQTGHNSGVIHSGIYYQPGSLKAELCRRGAQATRQFAAEHGIPYDTRGKLLVATTPREVERMAALQERSAHNGLAVERLDAAELRRREPNVVGLGALFVPSTGIVDYGAVSRALGAVLADAGTELVLGAQVTAVNETASSVEVQAGGQTYIARQLVVCAGLQADRIARMAGLQIDFQIVPFRGEYYRLPEALNGIVHHLVYPIPDPELPFLGVHLTPMIDGRLTVGPNAVLGLAREGYPKWSFARRDVAEYLRFPGMHRVARANVRVGARELFNSTFKRGYLRECRKYCPSLGIDDLLPQEAGIRAQAVLRDGTLVHDFLFAQTDRMLHVCNAPSPAATSALPIGEMIAARVTAAASGAARTRAAGSPAATPAPDVAPSS